MVHAQPDTTSIPSAASTGVPSPLAATALTPDMAPIAHHPQATSHPHPLSIVTTLDFNSLRIGKSAQRDPADQSNPYANPTQWDPADQGDPRGPSH
ncbi:hypothetical protein ACLOJK_028991 [Asimina triloba]